MKVWCRLWLSLCLFAWASCATAQTSSFESMMNSIIRGTPGITNVPISSGVTTSASGSVAVAADGFTIPVATTVAADVSAGAIAAGAARVALRAVPYVGAAILIGDVASMISGSGIHVCPPPDFFCKPGSPTPTDPVGSTGFYARDPYGVTYYAGTGQAVCDKLQAGMHSGDMAVQGSSGMSYVIYAQTGSVGQCHTGAKNQFWANVSYKSPTCPAPAVTSPNSDGTVNCVIPGKDVPATEADINSQLTIAANIDHNANERLIAEMQSVSAANPAMAPPYDVSAAPLTVTAPPVTTQPQTVSTRTYPNDDGTTSTETITKTTTVTAVQGSPSTVANPNTTYNPVTTTTTTTVNNTTNVTNISTTTVNNPPVIVRSPSTSSPNLPTDYNREATQQKILNVLNGDGMPTAALGSSGTEQGKITSQNNSNLAAVNSVSDSSVGITNWFPDIPTAACVNPQVPNPITGAMVDVQVCDKVSIFTTFISGVIAVFCLFGCVQQVTAAIKS